MVAVVADAVLEVVVADTHHCLGHCLGHQLTRDEGAEQIVAGGITDHLGIREHRLDVAFHASADHQVGRVRCFIYYGQEAVVQEYPHK
ncbi:hypothetical protein D3C87_2000620 [compost metagenome]